MLLCAVVRAALSASFASVVHIVIYFLQNSCISKVHASLPPGAEDEIILIEHLPGRRVHLQDFFWTDAEDAPPWVDPNQGLTFYETRTIHQTVTVYSPDKDRDVPETPAPNLPGPECTTCIEPTPRLDDDEDQNVGILIGEDPGPRYWLLTVLRAGETVPPKIELKLARLYRAAFSRQQQRHLGLLSTDPRSRREAKDDDFANKPTLLDSQTDASETLATLSDTTDRSKLDMPIESQPAQLTRTSKFKRALLPALETTNSEESSKTDVSRRKNSRTPEDVNSVPKDISQSKDTFSTDTFLESSKNSMNYHRRYTQNEMPLNSSAQFSEHSAPNRPTTLASVLNLDNVQSASANSNTRSRLWSLDNSVSEVVQVRMQNMSVIEGGATRLIYSVHLGGKPVPAETAARDMALLSPQEVALELGAPVIIQSEPYLKESRPLALSRRRDAWLLIGAASAGVLLLIMILAGLIIAAKRKRAHSAVAAPPSRSILKKEREYIPATPGLDTGFSTTETDIKLPSGSQTDGTSQRQTPGTLSATPVTPETPRSLDNDDSTDNEDEAKRKLYRASPWNIQEHPLKRSRLSQGRMTRTDAVDPPKSPDSIDTVANHLEVLESLENGYAKQEEATASPHSYLSMPSCKQFPSMRTVEPLSRVLEPVMVRHLDIDSPELMRRSNGRVSSHKDDKANDRFLTRASSASKDPGVLGPIVWNLRKQGMSAEGNGTSETDADPVYMAPTGPVGRARRRLHDLLEDSFSLFGSRDSKTKEPQQTVRTVSAAHTPDAFAIFSEGRGRSAHVSPVTTPTTEVLTRPRTSLLRRGVEEEIPETGRTGPRGAWGSRPLSAGPFHRPNLPEVDTRRILADSHLPPEDPAVPLIASIKKELEKFSPQ